MTFLFSLVVVLCSSAGAVAADASRAAQLEYLRGALAHGRGELPEALAAYEQALSHDPRSAFINREAAELALESGQNDKALVWAAKAVELEPTHAESQALLGRVQLALGDVHAAERAFEAALKLDPKSAESIFSLGAVIALRSPEKARELLRRFLEQDPVQAAEAHFQLAKIEIQLGRVAQAQKHLAAAIALEPDAESLSARYILAQSYEAQRSTDAALAEYLKIARLDPQNVSLLGHIAQIYYIKGDWDNMRDKLLEAKGIQNDEPTANHWLALDAERRGNWAQAAAFLKDSAALKEEPSLNLRLGYFLTQAGRLKDAVEALEAAAKTWPANDQILYFLALGYDDLKREGDAIKLLTRALELKPELREARYQLAMLWEKTGNIKQAETEFRILLAERPNDPAVLNYLGYSLADRGLKLDEARAMIERAVAIEPENPAFIDSLGWVYHKLGRSTEAVVALARAAALLPEDETVWDHLGEAHLEGGDPAAAWKAWKRAELLLDGAKKPAKAKRLERLLDAEKLGALYLDHLALTQGGLRKISGLSRVTGRMLGRELSFPAFFTFQGPGDIDLELLGPMFTPVARLSLSGGDFAMDPLRIEGLPEDQLAEAARHFLTLVRDYLSGRVFQAKPARFHRTWRGRRWLDVEGWTLCLDKQGQLVERVKPDGQDRYDLRLRDFGRHENRIVPRQLSIKSRGFSLDLHFEDVKITE